MAVTAVARRADDVAEAFPLSAMFLSPLSRMKPEKKRESGVSVTRVINDHVRY